MVQFKHTLLNQAFGTSTLLCFAAFPLLMLSLVEHLSVLASKHDMIFASLVPGSQGVFSLSNHDSLHCF